MAEIEGGGGGHKKGGKPKGKKMSTRVDFTPMVDLGFLLITFFMLTTSMNKPKTMEINMPVKEVTEEEKQKVKASQAITLLLAENDEIVYYFINEQTGEPETPVITNFSKGGIRATLLSKNKELLDKANNNNYDSIPILREMYKTNQIKEDEMKSRIAGIKSNKDALIVVIKADDKAKYKNLVDILDEMLICNIGRYAIVDISPLEADLIKTAMATSNSPVTPK
ncbi:MAG: biopolymer transporter ExbD [Bacteroidia bacterium]|nr:biopolymer transporter ExbD [Bacteroidia bacterium]MCF8427731.1 biopolymer transporter ExbD [Bacteroidia bacterium]MCF8446371.1 biopolymer transporter ExbD [Bacteroidia bacterium]